MAGEAVEPAGDATTAVFFRRCNSELRANHYSSYPQPSVAFTLLLFLQQRPLQKAMAGHKAEIS